VKLPIATEHGAPHLKRSYLRSCSLPRTRSPISGYRVPIPTTICTFVVLLAEAFVTGDVETKRRHLGQWSWRIGLLQQDDRNPRRANTRSRLPHQGVEDDHRNSLCMGRRTVGPEVAWDLVQAYLSAEYSEGEEHQGRLGSC
jgi:hypothetical protein